FGEIETENDLMSEKGMKNLLNFFEETKNEYHFSGNLWRPHGWDYEYHQLWAQNGWADSYCNKGPYPTSRYEIDAEDSSAKKSDLVEYVSNSMLFGTNTKAMGISLKANLASNKYYETTVETNKKIVYNKGQYKLSVRAMGDKTHTGDFIVGYKDVDGVVHQIARFHGRNNGGDVYHQTFTFTAQKPIASFVFFGCESKEKSVVIDRLYIEGKESEQGLLDRSKYSIPSSAKKIVNLSGTLEKVTDPKVEENNTSTPNNPSGNGGSDVIYDDSDLFGDDTSSDNKNNNQNGGNKNEGSSSNKNPSANNNKNENNDNDSDNDEDDTTTIIQGGGGKTTTTTTTTTTTGSDFNMMYIWIGVGIAGLVAVFVLVYIIVVKVRKKKGINKVE
ncbi:MAG: hypothetical protein IKT44_03010, partial [Clostridia bacterium]|nr:hypothetical protein [Clostridia bacterium]